MFNLDKQLQREICLDPMSAIWDLNQQNKVRSDLISKNARRNHVYPLENKKFVRKAPGLGREKGGGVGEGDLYLNVFLE